MQSVKDFFSTAEQDEITRAVKNAELDTSGEIRVHLENSCSEDVLDRAAFLFGQLQMHKTALRNGVLIYLAVRSRKFAIIGDGGINKVVPTDFWDGIKERMLGHFRENRFREGLVQAIGEVGVHLKKYFPYQAGDVNELPDEISFGEGK